MATPVREDAAHLIEHFGEQDFSPEGGFILRQGQSLPGLVWDNPDEVASVVNEPSIPTRWFNEDLEEVVTASRPGRYYAYGEGPAPNGPPLRRAMTCFCVEAEADLVDLAGRLNPEIKDESNADRRRSLADSTVTAWGASEEGAVILAGMMEADPGNDPVRLGQWQMENATRHVRLKRKLMGLDDRPPVDLSVRQVEGRHSPDLREGRLDEAGITATQASELEGLFDDWYGASGEPFGVVIARNGVVVLSKGYGELDGEAVTVDTPMLLHSAMKPLMGLHLAMFVDRGIVSLDQSLGDFLPDFNSGEDRGLTFRAGHVHVTGIHFPWDLAFSRLFYFRTWQDALIAHCQREWGPGDRFRYGVVGIILAVRSLELLRGMNYWDAMEHDLFEPLGIKNILPGGTGFSAENLARIGVLLDNHGRYGDLEFFTEETYRAILPTSLTPYFPNVDVERGIGLAAGGLGPGSYGHGGGCGTKLLVNPEKNLVLAMVRNAQGNGYGEHMAKVSTWLTAWANDE